MPETIRWNSLDARNTHMTEIVLPKRRFAMLRRILRKHTPGFYGWALGNATARLQGYQGKAEDHPGR